MNLTRREFLIDLGVYAAAALTLGACTPSRTEMPAMPTQEANKPNIKPLIDSLNMREIAGFPLAGSQSGINTYILTDIPNKISFNITEFQELFNQIAEVAARIEPDWFGGNDRKSEFIKNHESAKNGSFSGYNLYIAIPSNPHSCMAKPDSEEITVIPEGFKFTDVCRFNARTVLQFDPTKKETVSESLIISTGSADKDGKVIFFPERGDFQLTANQAVNSGLFHEMIFIVLSFYTIMDKYSEEEKMAEQFDLTRFDLINEGTLTEPLPVKFIPAESSIQRLKTIFNRPKVYEITTLWGRPVILY